ncbi:hypothetical protein DFH09DRAFT_1084917 [Mycena vulgaris]|nr:hypothetical protein DFH09DRAFT_1084917 [Mycena vulgaris]
MKSVQQKRRVGDSLHTDGALWRFQAPILADAEIEPDVSGAQTGMSTEMRQETGKTFQILVFLRLKYDSGYFPGPRIHKTSDVPAKTVVDQRPEGWLWQLGKLSKMTNAEMDEWSSEGDRVQWFRAEAEMQRWQEQGEQKLAELLRTNRSFLKMQQTWTALASCNELPGHQAYAKQKAAMYQRRAAAAQKLIGVLGYGDLLAEDANLIHRVQLEREKEARIVRDAIKK